jgi:hypothetical protein
VEGRIALRFVCVFTAADLTSTETLTAQSTNAETGFDDEPQEVLEIVKDTLVRRASLWSLCETAAVIPHPTRA